MSNVYFLINTFNLFREEKIPKRSRSLVKSPTKTGTAATSGRSKSVKTPSTGLKKTIDTDRHLQKKQLTPPIESSTPRGKTLGKRKERASKSSSSLDSPLASGSGQTVSSPDKSLSLSESKSLEEVRPTGKKSHQSQSGKSPVKSKMSPTNKSGKEKTPACHAGQVERKTYPKRQLSKNRNTDEVEKNTYLTKKDTLSKSETIKPQTTGGQGRSSRSTIKKKDSTISSKKQEKTPPHPQTVTSKEKYLSILGISDSPEILTPIKATPARPTQLSRRFSPRLASPTQKKQRSQSLRRSDSKSGGDVSKIKSSSKSKTRSSSAPPKITHKKSHKDISDDIDDQTMETTKESDVMHTQDSYETDDALTSDIEADIALIRSTDIRPKARKVTKELADLGGSTDDTPTPEAIQFQTRSSGGTAWSAAKILELCTMWEMEVHLYDSTHPDHSNRTKRAKSIQRMAAKLNVTGIYTSF